MGKNLLIVESPSKARTLQSYLGPDFKIIASVGHIKDLPKNRLGVDLEKAFEAQYEIVKGKEKIVKELRDAGKKADKIFLAPDPDREGEAIAWHIAEEIKAGEKPIYRVLFNEITKKAILHAISNPGELHRPRYESQQARRILDRLVGYLISPLLWERVKGGLSAGRVQSVALRIVCEREREIFAFVSQEYWSLTARLIAKDPPDFKARLIKYQGDKIERPGKALIDEIYEHVINKEFVVFKRQKKEVKKAAPLPFITSTLQQEASKKLGFTPKKTMSIAQQLYEGIDLQDRGIVGLITYMRTDSARLSEEALKAARSYIEENFGKEYIPQKPYTYKVKGPAQDAHEAIRPTHIEFRPEGLAGYLTKEQLAVYELIWRRFLASQMAPAIIEQVGIEITAGQALFKATGSTVLFKGFMEAYTEAEQEGETRGEKEEEQGRLPLVKEGDTLKVLELKKDQHFTQPPSRYTEATLIKALEENGIGRPSTYATIVSNILERKYVEKEKRFLRPTEMGFMVNDLLIKGFPGIMDLKFTARMEDQLDKVEKGELSHLEVISRFYKAFSKDLTKAQKELKAEIPTEVTCPLCGSKMVIRSGRNGLFLGCSKFPGCKGTANFTRDESGNIQLRDRQDPEFLESTCPKCGSPMVKKEGRYGAFMACSAYPKCKTALPLEAQPPKAKCPIEGCRGMLVRRRTKKGRIFYGCNRFPECKYTTWKPPESQPQD